MAERLFTKPTEAELAMLTELRILSHIVRASSLQFVEGLEMVWMLPKHLLPALDKLEGLQVYRHDGVAMLGLLPPKERS